MIPLQKVKNIIEKHNNLEKELASGKIDSKLFAKKSKEYSNLESIIVAAKEYINFESEKNDLQQILEDKNNGTEMIEMAKKDLEIMKSKKEKNENELKIFLLPKDEDDEKNAIVENRAGTGGLEASLFCSDLFKMYEKVCSKKRWQLEIINISKVMPEDLRVIFSVSGNDIYSYLKFNLVSIEFREFHKQKLKGGFIRPATVAVLPEAEEVDIQIKDSDLRTDVFRLDLRSICEYY